jgi:DNA repair protein RecO (recombination protein O)
MECGMEGIVISATEYKDNSFIVQILTRSNGVVSASVKTGKRTNVRMSYIQPLTVLRFSVDLRPTKNIYKLRECYIENPVESLSVNPIKSTISIFIAEILRNVIREISPDGSLYDYIADSVKTLGSLERGVANFHLIFLIRLTGYLGFFPNLSNFGENVVFDLRNGIFTERQPLHDDYLTQYESIVFAQFLRAEYETMHLFIMSHSQRNEILNHIIRYYTLHIPEFSEPKCLKVLRSFWE